MTMPQARKVGLPLMNLVRLKGIPILQQLCLEEELLRTSSDNWCIINDGTNAPTIVMGMSGKPCELLELGPVLQDQVPVIRRFTGGGTVIVDHGTIFISLICNKDAVPGLLPYPRSIMSWSSLLYNDVFQGIGNFQLRENDYVFGDRKFGGNAQSVTKNRWIHHTSFLWDYDARNMAYLKLPSRTPEYRLILMFRDKDNSFGTVLAQRAVLQTNPDEWWIHYGGSAPQLQTIAVEVLSQTTSSSNCQCNWCTFSLIHTMVSNRSRDL